MTDMHREAFEKLLSEWRVLERINGNKASRHAIKFCADQLEAAIRHLTEQNEQRDSHE